MKLFNFSIHMPLTKEEEVQYAQLSRERFVPFLRVFLFLFLCQQTFEIFYDYLTEGHVQLMSFHTLFFGFYLILILFSYVPGAKNIIHILAIISIVGDVFLIGFISFYIPAEFKIFWVSFYLPLLFVPLLPSFKASFIALWLSVTLILEFTSHGDLTDREMASARNILIYYSVITLFLSYLVTLYRRSSFLLEKNLEKARKEAEEANEAKSNFLATMSHEVRTPLNGILGLITLMKDTSLDQKQGDYVETIKYSGETLLTILNDILDFSKMEAGKFDLEEVTFNLERLVHSVVTLMRSRADEKGLQFDYKIESNLPTHIKGDPTRIRQVLLNLIGNSIKFTDEGGVRILISAPQREQSKIILHFEVSDTGVGISEEAQENLFSEFTQADSSIARKYGGTGLGLAICKKITDLMEGRIGVESQEGKGSRFWFEIPAKISVSGELEAPDISYDSPENFAAPVFNPLHVLVAEDNKTNQKVVKGLLERCGLKMTLAENGQEALDKLGSSDVTFDLVLMDMQMPVMDGITAAGKIRAMKNGCKDIPIIALTANTVKGDEQKCLDAGMNGYVPKPINPAVLYRTMQDHVSNLKISKEKPQSVSVPSPQLKKGYENLARIEQTLGREYVRKFTEDGIGEIEELIHIVSNGSTSEEMMQAAHDLRSLGNMFGLNDVEALAEGIEMCCSEDRVEEASILGKRLHDRYKDEVSALKKNYLSGD